MSRRYGRGRWWPARPTATGARGSSPAPAVNPDGGGWLGPRCGGVARDLPGQPPKRWTATPLRPLMAWRAGNMWTLWTMASRDRSLIRADTRRRLSLQRFGLSSIRGLLPASRLGAGTQARGAIQRTSGKRAKSLSLDMIGSPCSIAMAARCASGMRLPRRSWASGDSRSLG